METRDYSRSKDTASGNPPRRDYASDTAELDGRRQAAPLAAALLELALLAYSVAPSDVLFGLQEQLEGCLRRRQDVTPESVDVVLGLLWQAEMQHERRTKSR